MTAISIQLDGQTRNWSIGIYSEKFIVNLNYKQDWTVLCVSVGLLWLVVKILPGSSHSDIASVPEKQQPRVKGYQWTRRTRTVCSLVIQILLQNRSQLVNKWLSILIIFYVNISWCRTVFVSRDFPSSCCPCAEENWIFICDSDLESGTEPNTRLRFWSLETHFSAPDINHSRFLLSSFLATAFCCAHLELTPIMLISFDMEREMEERRQQEHKHFSKIEITFKIE